MKQNFFGNSFASAANTNEKNSKNLKALTAVKTIISVPCEISLWNLLRSDKTLKSKDPNEKFESSTDELEVDTRGTSSGINKTQ